MGTAHTLNSLVRQPLIFALLLLHNRKGSFTIAQ